MTVEIKEVKTRKQLKDFVRFPFDLYKNNPYWVPPLIKNELELLDADKNPDFEYCQARCWLAIKDGKVVGRIAGIYNKKFIERWGKKYVSFSRFDFIDDRDVSKDLFDQVTAWAESLEMDGVHGPLGFTTFDQQAILIEGFDELPTISSVYNYSYYEKHLDGLGCRKEVDYLEFMVHVPKEIPEKALRIAKIVEKREKLKIVKCKTKKELQSYGKDLFDVINASYKPLFYYVELTEKQIDRFIKKNLSLVRTEYILLILDQNERLIAFQITLPSLSRAFQKARGRFYPLGFRHVSKAIKNPKILDLVIVGILPEYQNKGINALFMTDLTQTAIDHGIEYAETNSELEDNMKVQNFWKYYESRQHKRKRIYLKML